MKPDRQQTHLKAETLAALRWPLWLTWAGLLAERAIRSFWPLSSLVLAVLTALGFGVQAWLSPEVGFAVTGIVLLAFILLLALGLWRFRWPRLDEALTRLDCSLAGRPLTALADRLAIGNRDAATEALWRAHLARMAIAAKKARSVSPDLRLSTRDSFGLRYLALTGFVMALVFGFQGGFGRGALPEGGAALASGPAYEGWIQPPRYTGLPVIYLNNAPAGQAVSVPEGSKVTLRLYGGAGAMSAQETVSDKANTAPANGRSFAVAHSGDIRITGNGNRVVWRVDMIPDQPPMISLNGAVEQDAEGQTRIPFAAADDYGVVGGSVTIALDLPAVERRYGLAVHPEPRAPITLDIPLPFRGGTKAFSDTIVEDLARHPWAGLPVVLKLSARDAKGQRRVSEEEQITLPGRQFYDPLAAAIVEQRRDLLWNRSNAPRVARVLRTISNRPEDVFKIARAYLMLRVAIRRIELNMTPALPDDVRNDVAALMWKTALLVEDGNLSDARARLRRAQDRLSKALKNGTNPREIARLSEELRRAMQDFMRQLAEKSPERNQARNGPTREITSDQLQKMLDRIQELARQGRTEEAQRLLEQLRQMMNNMRTARRQQGQGQNGQAMRNLRDTLRQQQDLSDDAFREMQRQFNDQGRNGREAAPKPGDLARRQEALRQLLKRQRAGLPNADSKDAKAARQALREAQRQMRAARDALKGGDLPGALDRQSSALQSLRKGLEGLNRQAARNRTPGRNGRAGQQGQQSGGQDPLGRRSGSAGRLGSNRDILTGKEQYMRSRALMDEIRRRTGDKRRPRFELDYLNRLLERF